MGTVSAERDCEHVNCHLNVGHYFRRPPINSDHNIAFIQHSNRIRFHYTFGDDRNITCFQDWFEPAQYADTHNISHNDINNLGKGDYDSKHYTRAVGNHPTLELNSNNRSYSHNLHTRCLHTPLDAKKSET